MPNEGMRSLCFHPKTSSFSLSPRSSPSPPFSPQFSSPATTTTRRSFTESVMEQIIDSSSSLIMKWNPDSSTCASVTSLFYDNRREALQFLKAVHDLQKSMHLLVSEDSNDSRLVRAQNLMQIAMKRLQKEFYQILSLNRAYLDPESVSARSSLTSARSSVSDFEDDVSPEDDVNAAADSISEVEQASSGSMTDLRSIAECMIASGYAKECVDVYKVIRKSIINEAIYRLGVEKISSSHAKKMDWEALDLKIKSWLEALKISMTTLFIGERILCDHVFAASDSIRESCFTEISKDGALLLFGFPEMVARYKKSPPEKMFRVLDMYTAISENWMAIESIFAFESLSVIRSQALSSLVRLSESIHTMLSNFESQLQKDSSKSLVPGGDVHPLTISGMNYLTLLGDYSNVLSDIISDWPSQVKSALPKSYFDSPDSDDSPAPQISVRLAWLILILLCKLDGKAKHYKDVSLSYLFLANNLQHVISKVQTSNLQYLLGEEWVSKHEAKLKQFTANYERLAWGRMFEALPENSAASISPEEAKEKFKRFNSSFIEAYRKQISNVIADPKLRDEMKNSIAGKITPRYREFYDHQRELFEKHRNVKLFVRYAPDEVENYLSDLFIGYTESYAGSPFSSAISASESTSTSSSSPHRRNSPLSS